MLSIRCASRWHEDVSRPSSLVLLERDEEACRGFCPTMSYVPAGEGRAPEASRATPAIGDRRVEVGAHHDGLRDSFATDIAKA